MAKLFDPIGWLGPVVVNAKILMQEVWKHKTGWDEVVPQPIKHRWEDLKLELAELERLKLPRYMENGSEARTDYLVAFSDASEVCYGASIYLCSYPKGVGEGIINLITSKTRVAPLQAVTLPRLELMGAQLASELLQCVKEALKLQFENVYAFTDSTITLGWIRSEPHLYKTFVKNRIATIQQNLQSSSWGHVRGIDNPADCASRGISPAELVTHPLWWHGPSWLKEGPPGPTMPLGFKEEPLEEIKQVKTTCLHVQSKKEGSTEEDLISRMSSFLKLQRVMGYVLRFINHARHRLSLDKQNRKEIMKKPETMYQSCQPLTTREVGKGLQKLIRLVQREEFHDEIGMLENKQPLPKKCKMIQLNPFLDQEGFLRVGGRIKHAKVPFDKKFQMLLPRHHRFTKMVIEDAHIRNLHAGANAVHSYLRQKYWIDRGKDTVRYLIRKTCTICARYRKEGMHQIMGDLPGFRVNPAFPFQKCGVDYAGPFNIKPLAPRSTTTFKGYLALFVCCVTKAIHLEVVSSASADSFLAALRRFIARRGKPSNMYSDNGTNFVGANNEMKEFVSLLEDSKELIEDKLSQEGIQWQFIPPQAPHFGGLWEAGVKSAKHHLTRVVGDKRLTFEELTTVTTQIEAVLNSRPLNPESSDTADCLALTPGHFLIGQPLTAIVEPDLTDVPVNRLIRWQLVQQMTQHFWKRWSNEYLSQLQERRKWQTPQESIKEGAMVVIKDDNLPPMQWKLGRVMKLHAGDDEHTRVVTVKASSGEYVRPIAKLVLLPTDDCG